ncbi:hypothetical protein WDW86_02075 [Bdellovibrionota bacterium FG-2]
MALQNNKSGEAYQYLFEERGIHEDVIAKTMVAVLPSDKVPLLNFVQAVKDAKKRVDAAVHSLEKKSRMTKAQAASLNALSSHQAQIGSAEEQVETLVQACVGWVAFFYVDHRGHITSIRFRKPNQKRFWSYRPFSVVGVFGLDFDSQGDQIPETKKRLLVLEGEFNLLQTLSLIQRHAESVGGLTPDVPMVAMGSVSCADFTTARKVCPSPVIAYDNDKSGAGFSLVTQAQKSMNVWACTTPDAESDLDSFIRGHEKSVAHAWGELREIIAGAKLFERDWESVADEVRGIRSEDFKEFELKELVGECIYRDLSERGVFYCDGKRSYVFLNIEKTLIEITPEDGGCIDLMYRFSLVSTEDVYSYVVEYLRIRCLRSGEKTVPRRVSYYSETSHTLYVFNGKNQIYRITDDRIELVDNGIDGVLFLHTQNQEMFTVDLSGRPTSNLFDQVILSKINLDDGWLSADEQRILILFWEMAAYFRSLLPTKPILVFEGPKGSTKTITGRKFGMMVFGSRFEVTPLTEKPDDFDALVTNSWFAKLDNVDAKISWLPDKLCTLSTGGSLKKRAFYTTNTMSEFPTDCFTSIATRTPKFGRDDVNDRLLLVRTKRPDKKIPELTCLKEVLSNRDALLTEFVYLLQEGVRALKEQDSYQYEGDCRMADFASFAMKLAIQFGAKGKVETILTKLGKAQSEFTLQGDPVAVLISKWTAVAGNYGKKISAAELCAELAKIADSLRIEFEYRNNVNGFSQKISDILSNLQHFCTIKITFEGGRKRFYQITRLEGAVS